MVAGLRGLIWVASLIGIGSWFGGDKIENQTNITEKWTIIDYIVAILVLASLIWLVVWLIKYLKNK
jgi:hypothetical protein